VDEFDSGNLHECLFCRFIIEITSLKDYKSMSYILKIATAVPDYGYEQTALMQFYRDSTDDESTKRKIKILAAKSGISTRYSVLKDYGLAQENFTFFPKNKYLLPTPTLSNRMAIFRKEALKLSLKAIQNIPDFHLEKDSITHIITVTCTGLFAPGLDIELIQTLDLQPTTHRSSVNFLGCNAAIIALKQADAICKSQAHAKVLVVCTELCTLHFQTNYSDDYLLSNLLFADGSAAVLVGEKPKNTPLRKNLRITGFDSFCIPDSHNEMAWQLSETGFIMNLTSYVADLIKVNIKQMLSNIGLNTEGVDYWAVHPGGKKIVDNFATALALLPSKLTESYQILRDYGNMSSPTVLFVLKQILDNIESNETDNRARKNIFAAAFGPGLTVETMQLTDV
jgi:predicted naringenin-chalcone synthase